MENQTAEKEEPVTGGSVNWDQLVSDFRNKQDDVSFEALYRSSYSKLYGYLYTLGHNKELAEDAIQNGFLTCYTKIDQLADGARFLPWMKQICYHEYLAMAKKQGRTVSLVAESAEGEEYDLSDIPDDGSIGVPESGIEQEELQKLLQQALDSLPELQRISLIGFYYDKKAIHSIADELGVPENTVKTYLSRGRRNMNRQVRNHATAYGLKLVPIAIVPVIAELLKTEVQACELSVTGGMVNASLASALAVGASKGISGTAASAASSGAAGSAGTGVFSGTTGTAVSSGAAGSAGTGAFSGTAGAAAATGTGATVSGAAGTAAAAATKAVSVKVVAGIIAVAVAGGGAAAVVAHNHSAAKEESAAAISTVQETESAEPGSFEAAVAGEDEEIDDAVIQAYITYLENREYGEWDNYRYTLAHIDEDDTPELIEINWSSNGTFDVLTVKDNEVTPVSYLPGESETASAEGDYHPFYMMDADERYYPRKNRILSAGAGGGIIDPGVNVNVWSFETFQNDGDGFYRDVNAEINFDNSSTGSVTIDGQSVPTDMAYTFSIDGRSATQEEYEALYNQMAQYEGVNSVSFYQDYDRDAFLEILKNDYSSLDAEVLEHENTDKMTMCDVFVYQGDGEDDSAETEESVAADYQEVIDVIKQCGDAPYNSDEAAQHEDYFPMALNYDKGTPGYILMDLNGDGTEELLLTEGSAVDSARFESMDTMDRVLSGAYIYAVFTVKDGQVVPVVSQGGVRDAYYLCEDGMIGHYSSGGASLWGYAFYKFDGNALTLQECIFHDTPGDGTTTEDAFDVRCFYTTAAPFVDKTTEITQEDFDTILNKHSCKALSPTPIL